MLANYNAGREIVINESHLLSKEKDNCASNAKSTGNDDVGLFSFRKISYHNPPNFYDDWYLVFPQLSILVDNLNILIEDYKQIRNVRLSILRSVSNNILIYFIY